MNDFFASEAAPLFKRHGLDSFAAIWALQLDAVDEPNTGRGGWSSVYRLELEGQGFYVKRQSNYLTRTLRAPLGEPTFARELHNIVRYQKLGIPALQAVFYGQRREAGQLRAVLVTRALDSWTDLDTLLEGWAQLAPAQQQAILQATGKLARTVHAAGQVHGCFYPKHIFLREASRHYDAQLIDLEKTRPLLFGQRDRVRDLEPLLRRAGAWQQAQVRVLLAAYLHAAADSPQVDAWVAQLDRRRSQKGAR